MNTKSFPVNPKSIKIYREDKMEYLNSWRVFEETGKIEDYLNYAKEKKIKRARENFISKLEGKENGRDNNSSGNGDFPVTYK